MENVNSDPRSAQMGVASRIDPVATAPGSEFVFRCTTRSLLESI